MSEVAAANTQSKISGSVIGWGLLACIISIIIGFNINIPNPGFMVRATLIVASIIGGTPGGIIGALIGNVIRQAAMPAAVFTTEGMSGILKARIFWAIGPQVIGCLVGAVIGCMLTSGLLALYVFGGSEGENYSSEFDY